MGRTRENGGAERAMPLSLFRRLRAWLVGRVARGGPLPPLAHGTRVRLRVPLTSRGTVWVPAGAAGTVVGGEARGRRVTVELDAPRTLITVPRGWLEVEERLP